MYAMIDFKSKKDLKEAVKAWLLWEDGRRGVIQMEHIANPTDQEIIEHLNINAHPEINKPAKPVTIYSPGIGTPVRDGTEFVEGPHYPAPHRWYAKVEMKDGVVVSVK